MNANGWHFVVERGDELPPICIGYGPNDEPTKCMIISAKNGGLVLWKNHLQPTVADSPTAAEYIVLLESVVALMALHILLKESGVTLEDSCLICEDTDGSRRLAVKGMGQKKARHLQNKYHYIQELLHKKKVKVVRVVSVEQPVDLLTKGSHTSEIHLHMRAKLCIVSHACDA